MALTEKHIWNIFVYVLPRFIGYGINILTLPILTRILSPADFGIITLAWIFPSITAGILTLCLGAATQRFYFEYKSDKKKLDALIFSSQVFLYAVFILSAFIVFFFKGGIAQLVIRDRGLGQAVFITFLAAYLAQIVNFYLLLYQSMEKARLYSVFTTLQTLIYASASLLLVWGLRAGYMGMLYGSLIGESIVCAVILVHFNQNLKADFRPKVLWENIKFGLQIVPKSLTGFINRFFDKYMLNNMLSLSVVGVYNIGQNIGNTIFILMNTIWSSFQPVCYSGVFEKGKEASRSTGRLFTIFCYLTMAPLIMAVIFAQEVVYLLAPPAYYPAINIIIIICAAMSTNIFGMFVGVQYAYSKKAYWIFPVSVIGTLANVGANIFFIPRFGLIGAGISVVVTYTVSNLLLTVIGQKLYRIEYEWRNLVLLFGNLVVTMGLIIFLRSRHFNGFNLYAVKGILLFLFVLIGVKAGIINRNTISRLNSMLKGAKNVNQGEVQPL